MKLQEAVHLADQSGLAGLRERAVGALLAVRDEVLEMMHISAGSRMFVEQFDQLAGRCRGQRVQLAHAAAGVEKARARRPGDVAVVRGGPRV